MYKENVFFSTDEFKDYSDEQIVELIINDNNQKALSYLCDKYKKLVNMKVGKYFMIGAEKEDIVQEGMIGLFKAIKSFKLDKNNSFKSFANMCIERQLITAIKTSNRQKHMPLNSYLSLNMSGYDNGEDDCNTELFDKFDGKIVEDPLDTIMKEEHYFEICKSMDKNLSKFEKQVLKKFMDGQTYIDIAKQLDSPVKSVDNAIQRIRKKAIKNIYSNED